MLTMMPLFDRLSEIRLGDFHHDFVVGAVVKSTILKAR